MTSNDSEEHITESEANGDGGDVGAQPPTGLKRAWVMTSATSLALGLVTFLVAPLAARVLGPTERGRLVTIQLLPQLLADLSALGLGFAIIHFGARKRTSIGSLLRWSLRPALLGSVIMFTVGQVLAAPITRGAANDERLLRIYVLLCPLTAFMVLALESFRAIGDFKRWNTFVLLYGLTWPVALVVGIVPDDPSLELIVIVHLCAITLLLVVLWALVLRRHWHDRATPATTESDYIRYGLKSAASTIPRSANAKLDQVVMSFRVGRDDLGLYAAAVGWSGLTTPVMRGLIGVSMPHLSGAREDQVLARTRQLITSGLAAIAILGVGGFAATWLMWGPLYGSAYSSAMSAAMVLIPAALFLEYNAVLGNVLRSLDRPGLVAFLETGVLSLSTIALLVSLQFDPVLGPAIVSLATYVLACIIYAVLIARHLHVPTIRLIDIAALKPRRRVQ